MFIGRERTYKEDITVNMQASIIKQLVHAYR